jgi:pentatricopeptide repeat protein
MKKFSLKPDSHIYSILIDGYSKNSMIEKAEITFQNIDVKPNIFVYGALLNGYCSNGQSEKGEKLIRSLLNEGFEITAVLIRILIKGYTKESNFDKIQILIENYPNQGINTYNEILKSFLVSKKSPVQFIQFMEKKNIIKNQKTFELLNEFYSLEK